jgi:hypothetical protein
MSSEEIKEPTKWGYLAPLFFGLLGGLIGYLGVKDEDRDIALNFLVFGFFVTLVQMLLIWISMVIFLCI